MGKCDATVGPRLEGPALHRTLGSKGVCRTAERLLQSGGPWRGRFGNRRLVLDRGEKSSATTLPCLRGFSLCVRGIFFVCAFHSKRFTAGIDIAFVGYCPVQYLYTLCTFHANS